MSSNPQEYDHYEDEEDQEPSGSGEDFVDVLMCAECGKEFEVGLDEDPDSCPLCGAGYE